MKTKSNNLFILSTILVLAAGIIPLLAPGLMDGAWAIPTTMFIVAATVFIVTTLLSPAQSQPSHEVQSPLVEVQDRHDLMDQFLEELNETDLVYLREQLTLRDSQHDREVSESLVSVQ